MSGPAPLLGGRRAAAAMRSHAHMLLRTTHLDQRRSEAGRAQRHINTDDGRHQRLEGAAPIREGCASNARKPQRHARLWVERAWSGCTASAWKAENQVRAAVPAVDFKQQGCSTKGNITTHLCNLAEPEHIPVLLAHAARAAAGPAAGNNSEQAHSHHQQRHPDRTRQRILLMAGVGQCGEGSSPQ